ncbi:hypothetical protein [Methylobacterium sp. Leaf118]|uniref:hypothetical protein n=1 Tax=Methylobacterium sp. Leaf118 TaxID=2876562 RepID=UPI001E516E85|nr:hypothetical protein [Methylobacterium sp. Leaf118]
MTAPTTEAQALREALAEASRENTILRASLANSSSPCAYCKLPREEWSKCASGFPGCDRADDAMLCPHVGAELETADRLAAAETALDALSAEVEALRARVERNERALVLLLPFVDFAAGEGLSFDPDPNDMGARLDACDLCVAAAEALGHELGDPDYMTRLAAGKAAVRAALAQPEQEGETRSSALAEKDMTHE